jgi:hypothetical protein
MVAKGRCPAVVAPASLALARGPSGRRALLGLLAAAVIAPSCTGSLDADLEPTSTQPAGARLSPGEVCEPPEPTDVKIRVEPSFVVLPPCNVNALDCVTRQVNVVVDPDFCASEAECAACGSACAGDQENDASIDCEARCSVWCHNRGAVTFESSNPSVVAAPAASAVELHKAKIPLVIRGGGVGASTVTVRVDAGDGVVAEATLEVEVLSPELASCEGEPRVAGTLAAGGRLAGDGALAGASIAVPEGADKPNEGSYLWSVEAFDAAIECGGEAVAAKSLPGYIAIGPAITFGEDAAGNTGKAFQRELPMSIPLNPARMPAKARWRHLRVAYSSPDFSEPRVVPVADPRVEKVDDVWTLTFKAPRLGTYQAVVQATAGTKTRKRRLTHRAVIGVSMGGGGTAQFGMRHHDLFDVLAPLGGPVDWTWLLNHIENNHLGGFRSIAPGTTLADIQLERLPCSTSADCQPDETCVGAPVAGKCTLMPVATDPYAHPQTFNTWWNEFPRDGTGGRFPRDEYAQIFRDLALMFGNPNGENLTPGAENLPAGVPPNDPSQIGEHRNGECKVWVDPLEGHPDQSKQQEIASECPAERCANTLTLQGYFDDEYNPDGTFPVITVCDGSPQDETLTPYANTWKPTGNEYPLELALAVDYDGDGQRDELEPIIRAGHERWYDWGEDGLASVDELGYDAETNRDPAGDDYHAQYNPGGAEGDHRHQPGEPFDDYGLDGVPGTAQQPAGGWKKPGDGYDVGEGDGKLTIARGLQRFWDLDAHSIVRQMTDKLPGGELGDEELARIDLWTDGGTRDLFNFAVDAQHLVGTFAARDRDVAYFTGFSQPIGLNPADGVSVIPPRIVYEDLQGIVMQRYGAIDPTEEDISKGSGQHVGTANEIAARLQTALYFIGSRWPEPELRQLVRDGADKPAKIYEEGGDPCEIGGSCEFEFESSFGRKGPVAVTLPPGYAHADQQDRRYPVIYLLHGYGQTPEDLAPAVVFLANWMNGKLDGMESRLPKAILVYVDGRCRVGQDGKAECIRGTFYTDSVRPDGAQDESWWLELMDKIDQKYRTMGPVTVEWTD